MQPCKTGVQPYSDASPYSECSKHNSFLLGPILPSSPTLSHKYTFYNKVDKRSSLELPSQGWAKGCRSSINQI